MIKYNNKKILKTFPSIDQILDYNEKNDYNQTPIIYYLTLAAKKKINENIDSLIYNSDLKQIDKNKNSILQLYIKANKNINISDKALEYLIKESDKSHLNKRNETALNFFLKYKSYKKNESLFKDLFEISIINDKLINSLENNRYFSINQSKYKLNLLVEKIIFSSNYEYLTRLVLLSNYENQKYLFYKILKDIPSEKKQEFKLYYYKYIEKIKRNDLFFYDDINDLHLLQNNEQKNVILVNYFKNKESKEIKDFLDKTNIVIEPIFILNDDIINKITDNHINYYLNNVINNFDFAYTYVFQYNKNIKLKPKDIFLKYYNLSINTIDKYLLDENNIEKINFMFLLKKAKENSYLFNIDIVDKYYEMIKKIINFYENNSTIKPEIKKQKIENYKSLIKEFKLKKVVFFSLIQNMFKIKKEKTTYLPKYLNTDFINFLKNNEKLLIEKNIFENNLNINFLEEKIKYIEIYDNNDEKNKIKDYLIILKNNLEKILYFPNEMKSLPIYQNIIKQINLDFKDLNILIEDSIKNILEKDNLKNIINKKIAKL